MIDVIEGMSKLVIAVLTGRRPGLLDRTLTAMETRQAVVWQRADRVVVHNGADAETAEVLDRRRWTIRGAVGGRDRLEGIGAASTVLADAAAMTGATYVLRLEDDWEAGEVDPLQWWPQAVDLLERQRVGQVRLRAVDEPVLDRCMVCRSPLRWARVPDGWQAHGHFTYNPSLMLVDTLGRSLPHRSEADAQRRLHHIEVAQHDPGVFRHLGGGDLSLRTGGGSE